MPAPYSDDYETYTEQDLREALTDFVESCHRTGNHDRDDNIDFFLGENDHIKGLTHEDVDAIWNECEN